MATERESINSNAAIAGHPLHPMMIHFPVAALIGLVPADLAYLWTLDEFWWRAALWLSGVGAIGGWIASIAGVIDLVSVQQIRRKVSRAIEQNYKRQPVILPTVVPMSSENHAASDDEVAANRESR